MAWRRRTPKSDSIAGRSRNGGVPGASRVWRISGTASIQVGWSGMGRSPGTIAHLSGSARLCEKRILPGVAGRPNPW